MAIYEYATATLHGSALAGAFRKQSSDGKREKGIGYLHRMNT